MQQPWADPAAGPEQRAELVLAALTLEEKVGLVHAPMGVGHFTEDYDIEGADVGYRWHERQGSRPLFRFGSGLTYRSFSYADLEADTAGDQVRLALTVTNTGERAGTAVPQFYAAGPDRTARLVGWQRIALEPGASARSAVTVDPWLLSRWDGGWVRPGGRYVFSAGADAGDRPLTVDVTS